MTSGPALPADAERPGEDIWDVWGRCGERAVVEALRCTWGEAYEVGMDGGQWWFRRKDGMGGTETAASPDGLLAQIVIDHDALPVRCPPPARPTDRYGIPPMASCGGTSPRPSPPTLRSPSRWKLTL